MFCHLSGLFWLFSRSIPKRNTTRLQEREESSFTDSAADNSFSGPAAFLIAFHNSSCKYFSYTILHMCTIGAMCLSHVPGKKQILSQTSLASLESLTMPLVQKIVISGDIRCNDCRNRIASAISRMDEAAMESVVVNVLEKNVTVTMTRTMYPP
ncbi:hypothetical protein Dimus_014726 [Dionaea muscipula]